ncbi:MAG: hypothetical protein NT094_02500 [Candidatus Staskawiczbacteria bacterium]|nr:hypothetical protein [Candidatus Staskawiczbacteria bacterium]
MDLNKPKFNEAFYAEQGPIEIMHMLEDAAEKGKWVELTVSGLGEDSGTSKQRILPYSVEGDALCLETENGEGMWLELSRIKMVQAPLETEQALIMEQGKPGE